MIRPHVIAASLSIGWMLSPDVLVRLGNGAGESRTLFLAGLGFSAILAALAVTVLRHPDLRSKGRCSQTGILVQGLGQLPAMTLILTTRTCLVLLLSTGLLVSAGFAFNEIFLFWFPNFGFSFLLLGLICLVHLAGERFARMLQPFFAGTVLICMFFLCLAGIGGSASSNPVSMDVGLSFPPSILAGCLLLFLGFDYGVSSSQDSRLPALGALFFSLVMFLFWSMLSLQYVSAERLTTSTVPHLTTAKEILGEAGRMVMGIAVISGVAGAVNMLFHLVLSSFSGLAERNLLPGHPQGKLRRRRFVLLFTLIIGGLLMGGLAGKNILETYIQASLLLWLLLTGMQCLAASRILKRHDSSGSRSGLGVGILYVFMTLFLAVADEQSAVVIRFVLLTITVTAVVSALWLWKRPIVEITRNKP